MIRVGNSQGFTIVETIIVLAVTSGLFVSAMFMMSGQQAKTEFRQAIGDTQSVIDDTLNDVATGYYSSGSTIECYNYAGGVGFRTIVGKEKGTSPTCIFLGRVIQFGPTTSDKTSIYTVAGFREVSAGVPVNSLTQAKARISPEVSMITTSILPAGLTVKYAFYQDNVGGPKIPVSGVAFVSTLGDFSGSSLRPGISSVDIIPLPGSVGATQADFYTNSNTTLRDAATIKNPIGGVSICLDSGGTNQHVILRIGVNGSTATDLIIRDGKSDSDLECANA